MQNTDKSANKNHGYAAGYAIHLSQPQYIES